MVLYAASILLMPLTAQALAQLLIEGKHALLSKLPINLHSRDYQQAFSFMPHTRVLFYFCHDWMHFN